MLASDIVEGKTQFFVNNKFGWEVCDFVNLSSRDSITIRTEHFSSWLHINDKGEVVDLDNKKYKFRNFEKLSLFTD